MIYTSICNSVSSDGTYSKITKEGLSGSYQHPKLHPVLKSLVLLLQLTLLQALSSIWKTALINVIQLIQWHLLKSKKLFFLSHA